MKFLKYFLIHLLTSTAVLGFWKVKTLTSNYAWFPKGKDILLLDFNLLNIFIYKSIFWLPIGNLLVFSFYSYLNKRIKLTLFGLLISILFFIGLNSYISKECASSYLQVYFSQSVTEEYIKSPLQEGGKETLKLAIYEAKRKDLKLRRYIISECGNSKLIEATGILYEILFDLTENIEIRADAYNALKEINARDLNINLEKFDQNTKDSTRQKVKELGTYFYKNK